MDNDTYTLETAEREKRREAIENYRDSVAPAADLDLLKHHLQDYLTWTAQRENSDEEASS